MSPNEMKALIAAAQEKTEILLRGQARIIELLTEIRDNMKPVEVAEIAKPQRPPNRNTDGSPYRPQKK